MYIYSTGDRFSKIKGTYLPGPGQCNKAKVHKRNKTMNCSNNSIMSIKSSPKSEKVKRVCEHCFQNLQSRAKNLDETNIIQCSIAECDVCYESAIKRIGSKRRIMNSERRAMEEKLGNSALDEECHRRTMIKDKHLNARGDRLSITEQDVDYYDMQGISDTKPSFNIATKNYFQKVAVNDSLRYFSKQKQLQER